jgi:hypothetical protein
MSTAPDAVGFDDALQHLCGVVEVAEEAADSYERAQKLLADAIRDVRDARDPDPFSRVVSIPMLMARLG